ncbi:MAG: calcium-binding protein [Candidatus Accumulibacter sp.]|nr:calcium-binding protein [Candidatus Accumulibacter conexus]
MYGGGGDDSFIIAAASHHAAGEIIDGGAGYDVIRFISTTEGDTLTLSAKVNVEEARIGDSAGSSSGVTEANIDASYVASTVGIALYGNDGNNHLTGNGAANRIQGGAGDDVIDGGAGDDELTGAGGSDTFVLSAGHDTITDFDHQPPQPEKLIDFELEGASGVPPIPDVYAGLYWTNAYAFDAINILFGGYTAVLHSGTFTAFDLNAEGLSFSDPNSDFNFKSGYFAAGYNWGLEVTFQAWDDGEQVGSATFYLNPEKTFIDFTQAGEVTGRFTSIDTIYIDGSGGSVAMDDLTLSYGGEVDLIDVADDMDIDALMASAMSDGMGNTTLYHAGGSITLVGVDPAAVSADWFV